MSSEQPKQNPPPQHHKGAHSCCCCMKLTWHMLRCPCKIIHAMVNHRCPARRKTKKIRKMPVGQDAGQKSGKNRLARMFELNMNMMENQHEGVLCEIMEDNHWVPFLPQHSNPPRSQQNVNNQQNLPLEQAEVQPIQVSFTEANNFVRPQPSNQIAEISAPIDGNIENAVPQSKKGKPRMVRSNLPSSSEQSEQHSSIQFKRPLKQEQAQLDNLTQRNHQIQPPDIVASIPATIDEFYDRLWVKMNVVPENHNQDKEPQKKQSQIQKNVAEQQKDLDSLQQQMANQCQFNFMCESDSNKMHQNQKPENKLQQLKQSISAFPLLNSENSANLEYQHPFQPLHLQVQQREQVFPLKHASIEQGQIDDNDDQGMVKQNDNSILDKANDELADQPDQARSHNRPNQPDDPLQQQLNQSIQRSQVSSLIVEEDQDHYSNAKLSEQNQIQQDLQEYESILQSSKQEPINHPKKQQAHQKPVSDISQSQKNEHESNFYSLALIKREGTNIVPVIRSRENSYMTQRQQTINHHYSQPQINRQDIGQAQQLEQVHSQHQQYQYNHEELEKEKSKKSRHSIRLNQELQSQEQRQHTQLNSFTVHNEKYEHNSEGERPNSHKFSGYSQFARSLPQFRKEPRLNIKQQQQQEENDDSDRAFEQAEPEEEQSLKNTNQRQPKQQSLEEAQNGVKSQRQEDEISGNSEVYDEEGSFPEESIESVQPRISSDKDSKEGQPQLERNLQSTPQTPLIRGIKPILIHEMIRLKQEQQESQQQDEEEQLQRQIQLDGVLGRKKVKSEENVSQSALASSKGVGASQLFNIAYPNEPSLFNNFSEELHSRNFSNNQDKSSQSNANQIKVGNSQNQPRLKLDASEQALSLQMSNPLPKHQFFLKRQPKFQSFQFAKLQNSDSKREKLELISILDVMIERGNLNASELALLPRKTKVERINIISQFSFSNNEFIDHEKPKQENRPEHPIKEEADDYQEVQEEIIYTRKKRPKSHRKNFIEEMYPSRRHKLSRHYRPEKQSKHRRRYEDYYEYDDGPYEYKDGQSNSDEERYARQRKKSKKMQSEKKLKKHLRRIEEKQDQSQQRLDKMYKHE